MIENVAATRKGKISVCADQIKARKGAYSLNLESSSIGIFDFSSILVKAFKSIPEEKSAAQERQETVETAE